ncbi:TPA: hypothetical protein MM158_004819 [Klebsiella pneumoniae]|nr:hypothetical protein [Klebsiella pneumoniae]
MKGKFVALLVVALFTLTGCKPEGDKFVGKWVKDKPGSVTIEIKEGKDNNLSALYQADLGGFIEKRVYAVDLESDTKGILKNELNEPITINDDGTLSYAGKIYRKN